MIAIFLVIELTPIFETTMISTALPTLMGVFEVDIATISWLITIFTLVGTGTAAIAGRLGDLYGRKRVIITLMAISTLGSILSVITGTFVGVLIGRALQGTCAGIFPLLIGLARESDTPKRVSLLASLTSGVSVIGGALGALFAGILLDTSGWHSMFVASAALAILAIIGALFLPRSTLNATSEASGRLDIIGALLLAPAIAALLFGLTISRAQGLSPAVLGFVAGGLLLLAFWIVWELKVANPMFNLRLFRNRSLVLAFAATAFVAMGVMAGPQLLTPVLQQSPVGLPVGLGLTPTVAGLFALIAGVVSFVIAPFAGRVAGRFGAKFVLLAGIGLGVVGYSSFFIAVHDLVLATIGIVVAGVGTALVVVAVPLLIVEIVPPEETSEAVGLVYVTGRTIFTSVGVAVIAVLLTTATVPDTTMPTLAAWYLAVGFVVLSGAAGFVTAVAIRRAKPLDERTGLGARADSAEPEATPAPAAAA
ncbi:MFS transporter [Agromyces sp. MMS24-JH15]|uniref:MFS transporter n=1 Tax=Agromyces sp. MMS24-JH15 TaxID=3243765 RepID=UPI00374A216A